MVSAVFHSPMNPSVPADARPGAAPAPAAVPAATAPAAKAAKPARIPFDWRGLWLRVIPPAAGLGLLIAVWALLTLKGGSFPTPLQTWDAAVALFSDPFYRNGPNDQGIGWNILNSLQREIGRAHV